MGQRNIQVMIECFIKKDGKYLMLRRADDKKLLPGVWLGPGGKREINEGIFECSRREVKEETGLDIKNLTMLATGSAYLEDMDMEIYYDFTGAEYAGGELLENTPDGELRWLTLDEILKLDNLLSEHKHILPLILKENPKFISYKTVYKTGNIMTKFQIEDSS